MNPRCTFIDGRTKPAKACPNEGTTYVQHGLSDDYRRSLRCEAIAVAVCKSCAQLVASRTCDVQGGNVASKRDHEREERARKKRERELRERRERELRMIDAVFPFVGAVRDTLRDFGIDIEESDHD